MREETNESILEVRESAARARRLACGVPTRRWKNAPVTTISSSSSSARWPAGEALANLTIDLHLPDIVVLILTTVQEVHDLDVPGHVARAVGGSQHWNSGTPSRLPSCLASPAAICFPQISHKTGFRTLATLSEDETAAGSEKNSRPIASAMVEQSSKNELCSLARCA